MSLGQKIKKLRTDKGLTQKDLAENVNVSFQTVSKWEKDENEPDLNTLKRLVEILDTSIDYLINDDVPRKKVQCFKCENEFDENEVVYKEVVMISGEILTKPFCNDCYQKLLKEDETHTKKNKVFKTIGFILGIVLIVVGFILAVASIVFMAIGFNNFSNLVMWIFGGSCFVLQLFIISPICAVDAAFKNRNIAGWYLLTILLGFIGPILIGCIPYKVEEERI